VDSACGLRYEKLSHDFVLAMGCVRHPGERGDSLSRAVWLVETRGGLAYRSTPFDTRESALAEYEWRCVLAPVLQDVATEQRRIILQFGYERLHLQVVSTHER
jgi:hypothetical protein